MLDPNPTPKKLRTSRKVRQPKGEQARARLQKQGFRIKYRRGQVNHCPGCEGTHWWVHRTNAECADCHMALDIADADRSSTRIVAFRPKAEDFGTDHQLRRFEPMNPPGSIERLINFARGR